MANIDDPRRRRPARARDAHRLVESFTEFSERGRQATLRGDFRAALRAYRVARAHAVRIGEPGRIDASELNVAMVRLQLGRAREAEDGLRAILLRTADPRRAFAAAYHLASSLRKQGRHEKAMAYAERALDRARRLGAIDLVAAAESLVGNILLAQSYADRALAHYLVALELRGRETTDNRYSRAILLENIGYCRCQLGELEDAIETLSAALVLADDVRDRRCRAECLQDLCYAHLLRGELRPARAYGEAALALAVAARYDDIEENAHYLLGELFGRRGDPVRRDEHFLRLQERHPELPFLKDFLCAVDVTRIITLKR